MGQDQVRQLWLSLSPVTREAIRDNQLPGGEAVAIDGYASTTDGRVNNFELAYQRAISVMDALTKLSGNQVRVDVFRPASKGEYESPTATDVKKDEREDARNRRVVVRALDVFVYKSPGP